MPRDELTQAKAELRVALQHAHTADAMRADLEAQLHATRAQVARADARAARTHAEAVTSNAVVTEVRRLCETTITGSIRVGAVEQATDTLALIESITGGQPLPGDAAWHSVWLHGNWRYLTKNMTTPERERAADAVARYSDHLTNEDPDLGPAGEPEGLRWWRD